MKQARPFVTLRGVGSGGGTYEERKKIALVIDREVG